MYWLLCSREAYNSGMTNEEPRKVTHYYVGIYLIGADGRIIGQQRDDKPGIDNPGRIASFGGTVEPGEDMPAAVRRELSEETNLDVARLEIVPYFTDTAWRKLTSEWEERHFFYAKLSAEAVAGLEVYEGQGWQYIPSADDPRLVDGWRDPLRMLLDALQ